MERSLLKVPKKRSFPRTIPRGFGLGVLHYRGEGFFFESEGIQRAGTILEQFIFAECTVLKGAKG